jgi:hypothetical protein
VRNERSKPSSCTMHTLEEIKEKRGPDKLFPAGHASERTSPKNEFTSRRQPTQRCLSALIDDGSAKKRRKDSASMRTSWKSSDYITPTLQNLTQIHPTLLPLPPQMDSPRNQERSGNEKRLHHQTMRTRMANQLRTKRGMRGAVTTGRIPF